MCRCGARQRVERENLFAGLWCDGARDTLEYLVGQECTKKALDCLRGRCRGPLGLPGLSLLNSLGPLFAHGAPPQRAVC